MVNFLSFPWFILEEVFNNIHQSSRLKYRIVCQGWDKIIMSTSYILPISQDSLDATNSFIQKCNIDRSLLVLKKFNSSGERIFSCNKGIKNLEIQSFLPFNSKDEELLLNLSLEKLIISGKLTSSFLFKLCYGQSLSHLEVNLFCNSNLSEDLFHLLNSLNSESLIKIKLSGIENIDRVNDILETRFSKLQYLEVYYSPVIESFKKFIPLIANLKTLLIFSDFLPVFEITLTSDSLPNLKTLKLEIYSHNQVFINFSGNWSQLQYLNTKGNNFKIKSISPIAFPFLEDFNFCSKNTNPDSLNSLFDKIVVIPETEDFYTTEVFNFTYEINSSFVFLKYLKLELFNVLPSKALKWISHYLPSLCKLSLISSNWTKYIENPYLVPVCHFPSLICFSSNYLTIDVCRKLVKEAPMLKMVSLLGSLKYDIILSLSNSFPLIEFKITCSFTRQTCLTCC